MEHKCPKCGCTTIDIWCKAETRVRVEPDGKETILEPRPVRWEWCSDSTAECAICKHSDAVYFFETKGAKYVNENILITIESTKTD